VQVAANIIYGVGFAVAMGVTIMKAVKISKSAVHGIQVLNMRLRNEGINLCLRAMPEDSSPLFTDLPLRL
jgi:hypothetical protein